MLFASVFFVSLNERVKKNLVPLPSTDVKSSFPPIIDTYLDEIVRPRPVPPYFLVIVESACEKALNTFATLSSEIPIPVSSTLKLTIASSSRLDFRRLILTIIFPCSGVNLTALDIKLIKISLIFVISPYK